MFKKVIKPLTFFIAGGLVYLYFDLYAPYCARHECCSSSGGWWVLLPNLSAILMIIGFMIIILGVFDYEPPVEKRSDVDQSEIGQLSTNKVGLNETEYRLADGTVVRPTKEQWEKISHPVDLDKETLDSIMEKFLSRDNTKLVPLTEQEVAFLSVIGVLNEMGYKTTDIMRMILHEKGE